MTQYIKKVRMEKARGLLETSVAPVKAVAAEVGYNDSAHFENVFKKACGSTPSQYRAAYLARIAGEKRTP